MKNLDLCIILYDDTTNEMLDIVLTNELSLTGGSIYNDIINILKDSLSSLIKNDTYKLNNKSIVHPPTVRPIVHSTLDDKFTR